MVPQVASAFVQVVGLHVPASAASAVPPSLTGIGDFPFEALPSVFPPQPEAVFGPHSSASSAAKSSRRGRRGGADAGAGIMGS